MDAKLTGILDELVEKRTLSLEGLEAISALRMKVSLFEAGELSRLEDQKKAAETARAALLSNAQNEMKRLAEELAAQRKIVVEVQVREIDLRVKEANLAGRMTAFEKLEQFVTLIFKNRTLRESAMEIAPPQTISPTGGVSYPQAMATNKEKVKE